jgi:hypothetical protein
MNVKVTLAKSSQCWAIRIKNRLAVDPIAFVGHFGHSPDVAVAHEYRQRTAVDAQVGKVDQAEHASDDDKQRV